MAAVLKVINNNKDTQDFAILPEHIVMPIDLLPHSRAPEDSSCAHYSTGHTAYPVSPGNKHWFLWFWDMSQCSYDLWIKYKTNL